ncbi:MAG TPA: glycoside hydrolase family 9 protein [Bacteroidales bacterium]|nr:glycoside hydrolase family 9 protein [Bacteroidales bacterium]
MNRPVYKALLILAVLLVSCNSNQNEWIRINQLGYRDRDIKVAVFLSKEPVSLESYSVLDAESGDIVFTGTKPVKAPSLDQFVTCYRLPFSALKKEGTYFIVAGNASSPSFRIGEDVYDGTADFLLNYMRQQRCGYNPYIRDSCHTHDGYKIYDSRGDSAHINVTGGWHDAADYLQYVTTSANAVYQMLFAYSENPDAFTDMYSANGLPGNDGIPDILNESRWGLDWLIKMNPEPGIMFNQIADDRDHIGFRYPDQDTANYGKGRERPVYMCTGKPQGLFRYKNRTTGIASTAGKYASAFARGAEVYAGRDPKFAELLKNKAVAAFSYGLKNPGNCQTAPGTAPYFYEEDNWTDDMELAAIELYKLTGEKKYLDYAVGFGKEEPVTPWMGADTARHYQWYPFVNMGHPGIAREKTTYVSSEFAGYMKEGLERVMKRATKNPFLIGIPFIWCSDNLVAALLTQAHLYTSITGDSTFAEMEAAHRDWLFGCNPWGTSMIVGLPSGGDYPENSHSSYVVKGGQVPGGLVDGPVYASIFKSLKYISLSEEDEYAPFQTSLAVYHDDYADYSTNECTMDGTACLVYYLSAMSAERGIPGIYKNSKLSRGAIVRMDTTKRNIYLCFTAHDFRDGFSIITKTLKKHNIKASFFLTGDFLNTPGNRALVRNLVDDGQYVGPHSNKHLLYCSWDKRDSLLFTKDQFLNDLDLNYKALAKYGIRKEDASVFLPPYEWYNDTISGWAKEYGLKLVNMSSGTGTNQDWTYPEKGKPYYSSDSLMKKLISFESSKGMDGYILLIHPGTDPRRKDKFYTRLDSILNFLEHKNYTFRSFAETGY